MAGDRGTVARPLYETGGDTRGTPTGAGAASILGAFCLREHGTRPGPRGGRHGAAARSERIGCSGMADGFCVWTDGIARRAAAGSRAVCAGAGTGLTPPAEGETAAEHREIRENFQKAVANAEKHGIL